MKKLVAIFLSLFLCIGLTGCPPIEQSARDGLAAASGSIFAVQQSYLPVCEPIAGTNPSAEACSTINRAIDAHNLAVDTLNLYCSGSDYLAGGPCQPNREFEPRLKEALKNLERIVKEVKGL